MRSCHPMRPLSRGRVNQKQSDFLQRTVGAAQHSQRVTGVPASITLAQAILESGCGQSALAVRSNNYFGIKARVGEDYREFSTYEFVDGRRVREIARFARYPSPAESFRAHAALLATLPRYRPAMAVCSYPQAFAEQLQACRYSTDPNYARKLMELVDQFDLTQYDVPPDTDPAKEVAA